jgi:eukaryotic-like serine/threonine-protein kinase
LNQPPTEDRLPDEIVHYRCACGNNIQISKDTETSCQKCGRTVSQKILNADLAATITLSGPSWDKVDTQEVNRGRRKTDALVGKSLGHFEILESLGGGGMGQVYRALDKSLQRYVAVKVLGSSSLSKSKHDELVERLLLEAIHQARINHPSVATIYYVGRHEGEPFLAMELVSGGTLANRLEQGPLPYPEAIAISVRIAEALKASHEFDLVHGDIKPSNLLLDRAEVIKLSDFGMARKASQSDSKSHAVGGTPNYLAPELFDGPNQSIQSDMYALGVTLFEMVFGRLPISLSGQSITQWAKIQSTAPIEFPDTWPENVPIQLRATLEKLLAKRPEDRYKDYDELLEELNSLKPSASTSGRELPRLIAWMIDHLLLTVISVGISAALTIALSLAHFPNSEALIVFFSRIAVLPPLLVYTWWVGTRGQSFGHGLMQLRVVNRYGLPPPKRTMIARSVVRMILIWVFTIKATFGIRDTGGFLSNPLDQIAALIIVANMATFIIMRGTRSLHDLIFRTKVVLDIKSSDNRP